jgi:hypothetical protein
VDYEIAARLYTNCNLMWRKVFARGGRYAGRYALLNGARNQSTQRYTNRKWAHASGWFRCGQDRGC